MHVPLEANSILILIIKRKILIPLVRGERTYEMHHMLLSKESKTLSIDTFLSVPVSCLPMLANFNELINELKVFRN